MNKSENPGYFSILQARYNKFYPKCWTNPFERIICLSDRRFQSQGICGLKIQPRKFIKLKFESSESSQSDLVCLIILIQHLRKWWMGDVGYNDEI